MDTIFILTTEKLTIFKIILANTLHEQHSTPVDIVDGTHIITYRDILQYPYIYIYSSLDDIL